MAEQHEPAGRGLAPAALDHPLLRVDGLVTTFRTDAGTVRAVDGVSFEIRAGETLAVVGESGCGKSVTSLSILRLVQDPPGHIDAGQILFRGTDLLSLSEREMRAVRGNDISMIFQEPMTSLNPVFTVGSQIGEAIALHQRVGKREARARSIDMLKLVGMAAPEQRVDEYPHQLSGGMRQRVMIAMALSCNPALLIADEPTTALDVTVQAQILELIASLQATLGMAVLLITHDLGVVAEVADRVAVMYAGRIVEYAPVEQIFARPQHPYTVGLLESLPRMSEGRSRLRVIPGTVPNPAEFPRGCPFHPRCSIAVAPCRETMPELAAAPTGEVTHRVRCYRPGELVVGGDT